MYTSLPQGGHYVSFDFWHFRPFAGTGLSSYKYNIYYIYYKRRNPTKPNETYRKHFFPTFSQRNQPKPKMSFCDVVSLHRENTKNAFCHFSGAVWWIRASCFYELRLWGRFAGKVSCAFVPCARQSKRAFSALAYRKRFEVIEGEAPRAALPPQLYQQFTEHSYSSLHRARLR